MSYDLGVKMNNRMKAVDCFYCQQSEQLYDLMVEIAQLDVSTVYLFKEQMYSGRCLVAYKDHVNELFDLTDEERNAFMKDVARVAKAISMTFGPKKINYGAYSDKLAHLHFHLVPKYERGPSYGGTFEMNPHKVYLSNEGYAALIQKIKENL